MHEDHSSCVRVRLLTGPVGLGSVRRVHREGP